MLELFDLNPKDRLIAQLLMSQGRLPVASFRQALAASKASFFFSLVEILIGQGLVTLADLEQVLGDYCRKSRLGELAMARGLVSEDQLELALALQGDGSRRIGEVFVELHFATPDQIETLLEFQRRCRVETAAC